MTVNESVSVAWYGHHPSHEDEDGDDLAKLLNLVLTINQSINRLFVKATLRIFQLTKAFKVATPDSRDIQEEAGRRPGNGGCRRQGNLYVGKPTQNHHQGTACGSG